MFVYSSARYERNGYGDMVYKRDAICGECGSVIGEQNCYEHSPKEQKYFFKDRDKQKYKFCPYCSAKLFKEDK